VFFFALFAGFGFLGADVTYLEKHAVVSRGATHIIVLKKEGSGSITNYNGSGKPPK
jgi:hypothetical protein